MFEILDANAAYLTKQKTVEALPERLQPSSLSNPICSVVITNYNYGHFLPDAIDSVLNQTIKLIEIIVVDDGSTDPETIRVVDSYSKNKNIRLIRQKNQGLSAARNNGIAIAKGKYICAMDADDLFRQSYIEQCVFELESHINLGFVFSWVQFFGDENKIWQTQNFNVDIATQVNTTCGAALFRKADWELVGGYSTKMSKGFEDWEFWLRISQLGRCGKVIPAPLFLYRRHGITMCHNAENQRHSLMEDIKNQNKKLYNDAIWKSTVKKYATLISPSHFPLSLAQLFLQSYDNVDKKRVLLVLSWDDVTGITRDNLEFFVKMFSGCQLFVIITAKNPLPLLDFFNPNTNMIFLYANSTPDDTNHFTNFLGYLIGTRAINILLGTSCELFYDSVATVKTNFPDLSVCDFFDGAALWPVLKSVQLKRYINQHLCRDNTTRENLIEHDICSDKIVCLESQ